MWRLITDHIWRWRVALACCGLLELVFHLGIWAAGQKPRFLMISPYFGALLMAIDWKASAGRASRLLPVPLGQLAAAWSIQAVAVAPAILLGVDLAVAAAKWAFAPELAPAASTLGMFLVFNVAGSGTMFLALTMLPLSDKVRPGNQFSQLLAGGLWGLGMGSGGLLANSAPTTLAEAGPKSLALTLAGLAMGFAGWWRLRRPPAPSQAAGQTHGAKAGQRAKLGAAAASGPRGYAGVVVRNMWQTVAALVVIAPVVSFGQSMFLALSGYPGSWSLESGMTLWRSMSVQVVLLGTLAGFRWWAPHLRQWKALPLGDGDLAWRLLLLPLSALASGAAATLCMLRLAGGAWPPAQMVALMAVVGLFTVAMVAIGLNRSQKLAMVMGISLMPLQGFFALVLTETSTRFTGLLDLAVVVSALLLAAAYAATRAALRSPAAMGRPRPAAMAASPGGRGPAAGLAGL